MVGLFNLESCYVTTYKKLSFRRIKRQEVKIHPVEYVSYNVFKASDVTREIQS